MPETPPNPEKTKDDAIEALSKIGIYEDLQHGGVMWTPEGYLIGSMIIGKVAFSARVQNPETFDFNQEFARMIASEQATPDASALQSLDDLIKKTAKQPKGTKKEGGDEATA